MGINIGDIQRLQREAGQAEDDQTQPTQSDVDPSGILTDAQEPSKILPDEKLPIAENEAPKEDEQDSGQASEPAQDAPLTKEMFAAQMQKLTKRARAAGLNPIQVMAQTYARQGMVVLEGILAALENENSENESSSKKKKKG